jgi:hypothetical protein
LRSVRANFSFIQFAFVFGPRKIRTPASCVQSSPQNFGTGGSQDIVRPAGRAGDPVEILGSGHKGDFGGAILKLTHHESIDRVCKPGGWLQFVEPYHNIQSDNGTLTDDHAIRQVSALFARAIGEKKDIRVPMRIGEMMRNAGLVSVSHNMIQVPLNDWPAGMYNHRNGL